MSQGMPAATFGRQRRKEANELIISYLYLRKSVGWIGILLPFALLVGNIVISGKQPESISGYYYTGMRNVLVGALCILGVFLIAYAGYDEVDRWITNLAGIGALGVAFFPTSSQSFRPSSIGVFHHIFATTAMTLLGVMALQFMKMKAPAEGKQAWWEKIWRLLRTLWHAERVPDNQPQKKMRNTIYRICAWVIFASVVLGAAQSFVPSSVKGNSHLLFWFETLALLAFGASWLVKGQTLSGLIHRMAPGVSHQIYDDPPAKSRIEAAQRWADVWERGWREHDASAIAALYAECAFWQQHPFREPEQGYLARVFAEEESAQCRFGTPIVDGDQAAVPWSAQTRLTDGGTEDLAGVSLLRFRDDGLVLEERDFWAQR